MITLTDDEKRNLAVNYEHIPDRDLIRELLRRGRLSEYNINTAFYSEMRDEQGYMKAVKHGVLHKIVQAIADDKDSRPALLTEGAPNSGPRLNQTVLTADIIVLNARSPKEG